MAKKKAAKKKVAKKKKKKKDPRAMYDDWGDDKVIVETSTGYKVECLAVGDLLDGVGAGVEFPDVPTYEIVDVAGSTEERPYTDKMMESDKEIPDEVRKLWAEYKLQLAAAEAEVNVLRTRFICLRGLKVLDQPPEEEWMAEHEFLGLVVPEGELERQYHFVYSEVLRSRQDAYKISVGIYRATGVDKEVLDSLEESFRAEVGRSAGQAVEKLPQDTGGGDEKEA